MVDLNKEARKRARNKAKKARRENRLKQFSYIEEMGAFGISKVRCKCGQVLSSLKAVPGLSEIENIKGRTIVRERVAMASNAAYTEIVITFNDGSKHVTPVCKSCAKAGFSEEALNDMYAADMERWDEEETRGLGKVRWDLNADRVAVSYKEVPAEERFRD